MRTNVWIICIMLAAMPIIMAISSRTSKTTTQPYTQEKEVQKTFELPKDFAREINGQPQVPLIVTREGYKSYIVYYNTEGRLFVEKGIFPCPTGTKRVELVIPGPNN